MAFNIFKRKEEKYPAEEKAEILSEEELPPLPEMEPLPELPENIEEGLPEISEEAGQELELPEPTEEEPSQFETGFRPPEEMMPPVVRPRQVQLPMPPTREQPEEISTFPEVSARTRTGAIIPPHIYIKIAKYKEVMNAVRDLHRSIEETKQDLEDMHAIGKEEETKLRESAEVVLKIEDLLKYLEATFTQPED